MMRLVAVFSISLLLLAAAHEAACFVSPGPARFWKSVHFTAPRTVDHREGGSGVVADNDDAPTLPVQLSANPLYGVGRIQHATKSPNDKRQTAEENEARRQTKIRAWAEALSAKNLAWGSRQAVTDVPVWATPEVLQGGFASGKLKAELKNDDETRKQKYYLSEEGLKELDNALENGCFRLQVPEHGALLMVVWLLRNGETREADALLEEIGPYLDRLRFFPDLVETPMMDDATSNLCVSTVGEAKKEIQTLLKNEENVRIPRIRKKISNRKAILDWLPLKQKLLKFWVNTCKDDKYRPGQRFPRNWKKEAERLVDEFEDLADRDKETNGGRIRKGSTYEMASCLTKCLSNGQSSLSQKDLKNLQIVVQGNIQKRGLPSSNEFEGYLRELEEVVPFDQAPELRALIDRLNNETQETGLDQERINEISKGLSDSSTKILNRTRTGTIGELITLGLVPSSEALAVLIPKFIAQVATSNIPDASLRRLALALDVAFRSRQSVLLFNLQSQVRLDELPWAKPVLRYQKNGENERAKATLKLVVETALTAFPQTILPNKLLGEMKDLAHAAGMDLKLTKELASDIFMVAFSKTFEDSARLAAKLLKGSVYERYYGLDYEEILRDGGTGYLARVSVERAKDYYGFQYNSGIIEQQQIITTHNLASCYSKIQPELNEQELVLKIWDWMLKVVYVQIHNHDEVDYRVYKDIGYAWRQLVFFISFTDDDHHDIILTLLREKLYNAMAERVVAMDGEKQAKLSKLKSILEVREFLEENLLSQLEKALHGEKPDRLLLAYDVHGVWCKQGELLPSAVSATKQNDFKGRKLEATPKKDGWISELWDKLSP